jgi:arginine-tRNA-protein transferase
MRYKGRYCPSELLCPEAYTWHPVTKCFPVLDTVPYSRFDEDPNREDDESNVDMDNVVILHDGTLMRYSEYKIENENDNKDVKEYSKLVGRTCAYSMCLYRD